MTRNERRTMSGMTRLMPNRRERADQVFSCFMVEAGKAIPELILGALVFGFLFLLLPIMAAMLYAV